MNYILESSFLNDETFSTILWAEKMLANFVHSTDDKLGLNKCSPNEKKVMKVLCKSFQVEYYEDSTKCYLERTPDTRAPYLTIHDLLTKVKIDKHFYSFESKFHNNVSSFPCHFKTYKSIPVEKEDFPRLGQKPTNKEMSHHENSHQHSRTSSLSSNKESSKSGGASSLAKSNI